MKIRERPSTDDVAYVKNACTAFERQHGIPDEHTRTLRLVLSDERGKPVGGLLAHTMWRSLLIDTLWIEDGHRRKGYGRELVEKAEAMAVSMGCCFAMVGTFESYGARTFYEKLGYRVVSTDRWSVAGQVGNWFHKELR